MKYYLSSHVPFYPFMIFLFFIKFCDSWKTPYNFSMKCDKIVTENLQWIKKLYACTVM